MKRFHVHVSVEKLDDSILFYTSLFGTAPTVVQPDYAKWMLDDPRVNFAISQRGRQPGVNHRHEFGAMLLDVLLRRDVLKEQAVDRDHPDVGSLEPDVFAAPLRSRRLP